MGRKRQRYVCGQSACEDKEQDYLNMALRLYSKSQVNLPVCRVLVGKCFQSTEAAATPPKTYGPTQVKWLSR